MRRVLGHGLGGLHTGSVDGAVPMCVEHRVVCRMFVCKQKGDNIGQLFYKGGVGVRFRFKSVRITDELMMWISMLREVSRTKLRGELEKVEAPPIAAGGVLEEELLQLLGVRSFPNERSGSTVSQE